MAEVFNFSKCVKKPIVAAAFVWLTLFILILMTWVVSKIFRPKSSMVYDMCTEDTVWFYYSFKVKMGQLPKLLLTGAQSMKLDLIDKEGTYVTRLEIPVSKGVFQGKKSTVIFTVGRKHAFPKQLGYFRVDHNVWGQTVFVDYIDVQDMNPNGRNNIKAEIGKEIEPLYPLEDIQRYKTEGVFAVTESGSRVGGEGRSRSRSLLTPTEIALFFALATCIVMQVTLHHPKDMAIIDSTGDCVLNGLTAGAIAVVSTLTTQIVYKVVIKRYSLPYGFRYTMSYVFMLFVFLASVALTALSVSQTSTDIVYDPKTDTYFWMIAIAIGLTVYILIGLPLTIASEYLIKLISSSGMPDIHETTISAVSGANPEIQLSPA